MNGEWAMNLLWLDMLARQFGLLCLGAVVLAGLAGWVILSLARAGGTMDDRMEERSGKRMS